MSALVDPRSVQAMLLCPPQTQTSPTSISSILISVPSDLTDIARGSEDAFSGPIVIVHFPASSD